MPRKILKYDYDFYTPSAIRAALKSGEVTRVEILTEFNKLRVLAKSRSKSFARAGRLDMDIAQRLTKLANSKFSNQNLAELAYTLSLKTSTVRGVETQNRRRVATLKKHGYDFVNLENVEEFGRFMQDLGNTKLSNVIGSIAIADMFSAAENAKIDTQALQIAFDNWQAADAKTKTFIKKQLKSIPAEVLRKAWKIK